jgi:hypothetical protein
MQTVIRLISAENSMQRRPVVLDHQSLLVASQVCLDTQLVPLANTQPDLQVRFISLLVVVCPARSSTTEHLGTSLTFQIVSSLQLVVNLLFV